MEMVNKPSTVLGLRAVEWRQAGKRRPGHVFPVFYCEAGAGSGMRCHCGVGVSLYRFVGLKGANVVYVSHNCPPPSFQFVPPVLSLEPSVASTFPLPPPSSLAVVPVDLERDAVGVLF